MACIGRPVIDTDFSENTLNTTRGTTWMTDLFDADAGAPGSLARLLRFARPVMFVAVALLVFGVASASARQTHTLSSSFGSAGSAAGQLSSPASVAVNNQTHDVYVADTGNARVSQFSASGTFIRAFGWGVADGLPVAESCTLSCQAGVVAAGALGSPTFIAVDNSAGPSAGDVYVADTATNTVFKFDGTGNLVTAWGSGGRLDGSTATDGPFGALAGITVDPAGTLDVFDTNTRMFQFDQSGSFSTDFTTVRGTSPAGLSVNAAGTFFKVNGDLSVEQFDAIGNDIGQVTTGATSTGIASDISNGDLYVDNGATIDYYTFATCAPAPNVGCNPSDSFGAGVLAAGAGLAVDPSNHTAFVANAGTNQVEVFISAILADAGTDATTGVQPDSAVLNGHLDPAGGNAITDCHFEFVSDAAFQVSGFATPSTAACAEGNAFSSPASVHADISGLTRATTYHARLVVANVDGITRGADQAFMTAGAVISATTADQISDAAATLHAQVNPRGESTTYRFEYGTDTSYGQTAPVAPAAIGSGSSPVAVAEHITGLEPSATYHFRLVTQSSVGIDAGPDATFHTYAASASSDTTCPNQALRTGPSVSLPDCRAYEQASPVDKHGAAISHDFNVVQASAAGDRITFADPGGLPTSGGSVVPTVFAASRDDHGWSTNGLLAPSDPGHAAKLLGWDEALSTSLSTAGHRAAGQAGLYLGDTATGTFHQAAALSNVNIDLALSGFSSDTSHLIFESLHAPLAPGAVPGAQNLYDLDHGALTLAGRIPAGAATTCNDAGATPCIPAPAGSFAGPYAWIGDDNGDPPLDAGGAPTKYFTQHTISADGTKVFFTAAGSGQLYMRQNGTVTTRISASQSSTPDPNGPQPAAFMGATPSGSKVFFASCERLTDDSTAASTPTGACDRDPTFHNLRGADLYSYDTASGHLADLTVDPNPTTDNSCPTGSDLEVPGFCGADVQGFLGASADGSDVYFVANGVLGAGASAGDCTGRGGRACNLYLSHDGDTPVHVASLGGSDSVNWRPKGDFPRTSSVSPNGTLIFVSQRGLTGYDNTEATADACGSPYSAGDACAELYRYRPGGAAPTCVSCNPTGAAPIGDVALAAGGNAFGAAPNMVFTTRNVSADGNRVFFQTPDPLVGADTNGNDGCQGGFVRACLDVYEWEATGTGSCHSTAADGGCLSLLSTGTSPRPSFIADVSASGDDVFIFTDEQLVPSDRDQLTDVYDVRVGGGLASQHQTAAARTCNGDSCQGTASAPPALPLTATVTFAGPGNAPGATPQKKVSVSAPKLISGSAARLRVKVPRDGLIRVSGASTRTSTKKVARAGTSTVIVSLTARAKRSLKRTRTLKARVQVSFKPATGAASAVSLVLTFKQPTAKHHAKRGLRAAGTTRRTGR
jgi:hypothetical protein